RNNKLSTGMLIGKGAPLLVVIIITYQVNSVCHQYRIITRHFVIRNASRPSAVQTIGNSCQACRYRCPQYLIMPLFLHLIPQTPHYLRWMVSVALIMCGEVSFIPFIPLEMVIIGVFLVFPNVESFIHAYKPHLIT